MAITLKLIDATVQVGGDFQEALSFVKGLDGRCYDANTKSWSASMNLSGFRLRCNLPFDANGMHQTVWGNRSTTEDFQKSQAVRHAEDGARAPYRMSAQEARKEAEAHLRAILSTQAANWICARWFANSTRAFDIASGKIRFTPETLAQVDAIIAEYYTLSSAFAHAANVAADASMDAIEGDM